MPCVYCGRHGRRGLGLSALARTAPIRSSGAQFPWLAALFAGERVIGIEPALQLVYCLNAWVSAWFAVGSVVPSGPECPLHARR